MEPRTPSRVAAVVLTGGASRRMGRHKPAIEVDGVPIVERVLAAVAGLPVVVVGRPDAVPAGVRVVSEQPPGGGPVAALAAGLASLQDTTTGYAAPLAPSPPDLLVVLAGDLPLLSSSLVAALVAAAESRTAVAVIDGPGGANWLCAAWPVALLRARLAALGDPDGASMRALVGDTEVTLVPDPTGAATDVDTPEDLARLTERPRD